MAANQIDLSAIELLVLDVDGVLTDGRIVMSGSGEQLKCFHAHDGAGMKYWRRVGKKLAVITGRSSPAVQRRMEELEVDFLRMGAKDKLPAYRQALAALGFKEHQAAVVGDDLTDIPLLLNCGFAVAVADATQETKQYARYVTQARGGRGAVREVIETILKATGSWDRIMARYVDLGNGSC